jgi:hypothetical protein
MVALVVMPGIMLARLSFPMRFFRFVIVGFAVSSRGSVCCLPAAIPSQLSFLSHLFPMRR